MTDIRYVRGDATTPIGEGEKVIAHVCNDIGRWGRGFVLALSARWPEPRQAYCQWHRQRAYNDFGLGAVQLVRVAPDLHVANMIGQRDIRSSAGRPPIRYDAVETCLASLADHVSAMGATVHMPRIGCGLAGRTWNKIEPIIHDQLCWRAIPVTIYDFT